MKRIILFVLLFAALKVAGQTTGYLRFDTVKIMKQNGTCELYIINKTKDSLGLLTNIGGGLTSFRKPKVLNDSQLVVGLDTLTIRGTGGGGTATIANASGAGDTLWMGSYLKRLDHDQTLTFSLNSNKILMAVDTITNVSSKYYARSQITAVPSYRSSFATDKLYQGQAYAYNWSDSAFYPDVIPKYKLSIQRGSGLITFGNSIASPSVTPPTDSMHSTILARNIGGPDSNFAVGGTNIHDALILVNQQGKLPRDRTQALLWQAGIDCREDTSIYADRAVYYSARVAAARAFYRDTLVLTSGMTFTGTWSNYNAGLAAGSIGNGRYTTTSGDFFDFQVTGKNAFFTFFSENPNDNALNFTDSVQVNVDGVYYGSFDMSNIGIQSGGKYLCAIFIQNMSNAVHNIRVVNRRTDTMAIDFAGSLKEPTDCYPMMCELLLPVGNGYIGGSGAYKKLRFNRLNLAYVTDIYSQFQRWGYPIVAVDPRNGVDMNDVTHQLDWLHPTSKGQRLMFQSIWPQINVYTVPSAAPAWLRAGNSSTNPSTEFLGTTDNTNFNIRVNNNRIALFNTNNGVAFSQYAVLDPAAQGAVIGGASEATSGALFGTAFGRSKVTAQGALAIGEPGCEANAYASFAQGIGQTFGFRSVGFISGWAYGDNSASIGFRTYSKAWGEAVLGQWDDTTGMSTWTSNAWIGTDPIFRIGSGDSTAGVPRRENALRINKNGNGFADSSWYYVAGHVPVTTSAADSNMLAAIKHVRKIVSDSLTAAGGGADGNGIYGGSGSLTTNTVVDGDNFDLTFSDVDYYKVAADLNAQSKADGSYNYSALIGATAANYWQFGYTPTIGVFSKGAAIITDTINNVGIGVTPSTSAPLYADGATLTTQALLKSGSQYNHVTSVTTNSTLNLYQHFITIDATSGNITITLPAANTAFGANMGIHYVFKRIDNTGNTVTIQRAGSDTIDGSTSFTLSTQWEVKELQCASTSTWLIK